LNDCGRKKRGNFIMVGQQHLLLLDEESELGNEYTKIELKGTLALVGDPYRAYGNLRHKLEGIIIHNHHRFAVNNCARTSGHD
jgi:hypothetical protein